MKNEKYKIIYTVSTQHDGVYGWMNWINKERSFEDGTRITEKSVRVNLHGDALHREVFPKPSTRVLALFR